ncbi:MAG: hypothetical protein WD076_07425 [Parvularculaceae bacterium]
MIARIVTSLIGIVLVVYGVIAALSPFPAGLPLVVLGLLMIAGANPSARPIIRRMRARWGWFNRLVALAHKHAPEKMNSTIEATDPALESEKET